MNRLCHDVYSHKMPTSIGETTLNTPQLSAALTSEQQLFVSKKEYINTKILFHRNIKASSDWLQTERPKGLRCHIADREFDDEAHFEFIEDLGDEFVIRLKTSRLSNQTKTTYTLKGKVSKRVVYESLVDKRFAHQSTAEIDKITFHGQTYHNVTVQIDWEPLVLNGKTYQIVRITLRQGTKPLFEQPMLLLTNRTLRNAAQAREIAYVPIASISKKIYNGVRVRYDQKTKCCFYSRCLRLHDDVAFTDEFCSNSRINAQY
jgi:hypothetical protein